MKILAIGFYDDFARFFLSLRHYLKKQNPNVDFYYISVFISGFFYFLFRGHSCKLITFKAWMLSVIKKSKYKKLLAENHEIYNGISINHLTEYHQKLDSKNANHYKLMALIYIDLAESFLKKNAITHLVVSGDSRIFCRAFIEVCKKQKNLKIYYFEQGAFGTTFMDTQGVNANSGFRSYCQSQTDFTKFKNSNSQDQLLNFMKRKRSPRYKRFPFYRGFDFILNFIFIKCNFGPKEIIEHKPSSKKTLQIKSEKNNTKKPVVFATQVPEDANMILHSPNFFSHSEILNYLIKSFDSSTPIVIREHPLYKGRYEPEFYKLINENKQVCLDNKTPLNSILSSAKLVVVNNSTVGIEALSLKKPVLVTGESYYDQIPGIWSLQEFSKAHSLEQPNYDSNVIYGLLNLFFRDYLYAGHFRDQDLEFTQNIATDILKGSVKSEVVLGS